MRILSGPRFAATAFTSSFGSLLLIYLFIQNFKLFNDTMLGMPRKGELLIPPKSGRFHGKNLTKNEMNLFAKLSSIQESCGQVCDTTITGVPGKYYEHIRKTVNCESLFSNADIDALSEFERPPKAIPEALIPEFTHRGRWTIWNDYRDESKGKGHLLDWSKSLVENYTKAFQEGKLKGSYGKVHVDAISFHLDNYIPVQGKTVLVIGSQVPWLESLLLAKGVKHITTFDYIKINSQHPQIEVVTPPDLSQKFAQGAQFDLAISFSSLEHSGLGRYGDMLNPWGDLIAMSRAWCLVKPGGYALIGTPTGPDIIGFNSHKIYGPLAYAHLFANWEQVYTDTDFSKFQSGCYFCYQPLHTLRRMV